LGTAIIGGAWLKPLPGLRGDGPVRSKVPTERLIAVGVQLLGEDLLSCEVP
jgi:hypothetical protein